MKDKTDKATLLVAEDDESNYKLVEVILGKEYRLIHDLSEISFRQMGGLLILSHTVCEKIAEDKEEYEALPSLLVMSPKSTAKA